MRVHTSGESKTVHFTGLSEFTSAALKGSTRRSKYEGGKDWCPDDWDTACRYFATGWREGREAVAKLSAVLYAQVTQRTPVEEMVRELVPREMFMVSPEAYLTGDPECWMEWQDTQETQEGAGRKLVHVAVDLTASAGVPAATLYARGAATLALVEALEYVGRSVALTGLFAVTAGWGRETANLLHVIPLKDYGVTPNADVLACAVAHPGSLRRMHFAVVEGYTPEEQKLWGEPNSYGRPIPRPMITADIHVPSANLAQHWQSPETAEAWILDCLRQQGVVVE